MQNIIQLLPDSVANQIAAGEVVTGPASVVKELVENAIDAGATAVSIVLKDAGRTLIQVIDNGCGMSEVDARMAFERHATSKLRSADDLFALHTFGFRGEALPSIVAVAEVEVKTRTADEETGTRLVYSASTVQAQEAVSCPVGTSIAVKNLFFNLPARRKFLGSDPVEFRKIEAELRRVALCHPDVAVMLMHNNDRKYDLPASSYKQRIVKMFDGAKGVKQLVDLSVETSAVKVSGYVSSPDTTVKTKDRNQQYLFVNGRYFESSRLRSAVLLAYDQLTPDAYPSFFIYLQVPPDALDINIHPQKIQVKFENEQLIWQVINSAVREAIGKFALSPLINFERDNALQIPSMPRDQPIASPRLDIDQSYNPFHTGGYERAAPVPHGWQGLYGGVDISDHPFLRGDASLDAEGESVIIPSRINHEVDTPSLVPTPDAVQPDRLFQLAAKYIVAPCATGLLLVDQARAHRRVLYEELLQSIDGSLPAQQELFPQVVQLSPADHALLLDLAPDLQNMGLELRDFGHHSIVVQATPALAGGKDPKALVDELLELLHAEEKSWRDNQRHVLAASLASGMAIGAGRQLAPEEQATLVRRLLACRTPHTCPEGKPTMCVWGTEEVDRRFLK
ncbi:MAG: DNA mismatch repair endonuclease MutL [Prevotellaceae bacterium]|jgi:DNA mismatch repair protein MutL|nr:DNA mismatch repair endonuclease MutL [Prevotellaceae bacterium]